MEINTWYLIPIVMVCIFIGMLIGQLGITEVPMQEETLQDICVQLTGNESAVFVRGNPREGTQDSWGNNKLVCELPSFDSTQNIIIKYNNEKKE